MNTPPKRRWLRISLRTTMLVVVTALTAGYASSAELPKEITNSIGMKLKLIPAGEFMMGYTTSAGRKVRITKPFYLGVTEVTQEQYEKVMGKNPSWFSKTGTSAYKVNRIDTLNFPVERVSWDDAVEFCKKLSAKEGETYRLPTEAEWEYACRAGSTTWYSFGDDESRLGQYAWFGESEGGTHPVGTKKPNAWGLYDMHGNVVEWCSDWYGTYGTSPTDDPTGPATGSGRVFRGGWPATVWFRVFRGGRFDSAAGDCQSSYRNGGDPSNRNDSLGFRVARGPSSK